MSLFTAVPTGYVLTSGANSALTWTNAVSVSSMTVSSLGANALTVSTLTTSSAITASTLTGSTITTTLLNYSSLVGSSISTNAMTLSLTNASTQNTRIYQVATTNPTTSYTAIQASHVSTGTTNNALALNPSGGNVGVGTTAPQATLHVQGGTLVTNPTVYNTAVAGWFIIGLWDCSAAPNTGAHLKLRMMGCNGYDNNPSILNQHGGETTIYMNNMNNFNTTTVTNVDGSWKHEGGSVPITQVKAVQNGSSRSQYYVYANMATYTQHSITAETTQGTIWTSQFTSTTDPGANSLTVRALTLSTAAVGPNIGVGTVAPAATLDVAGVIRGTVFTTQYVSVYAGNSTNTFTLTVPYPATYLFTVTGNGAYVGGGGDNYAKAIIYIHIGSSGVLLTTVVQAQGVAINSYTPGTQTLSYNIGTGGLPIQFGGNSNVSIIRLG